MLALKSNGEKKRNSSNFHLFVGFNQNLLSSTSGRVNNGRHFVLGSGDGSGNGRSGLDDIGPGLGMQSVRRTERERDSFDAAGDSFLHFRPRLLVELSDENHGWFRWFFRNLCILVLSKKSASALKGLIKDWLRVLLHEPTFINGALLLPLQNYLQPLIGCRISHLFVRQFY